MEETVMDGLSRGDLVRTIQADQQVWEDRGEDAIAAGCAGHAETVRIADNVRWAWTGYEEYQENVAWY